MLYSQRLKKPISPSVLGILVGFLLISTPCWAIPDFKVGSVIIDEEINSALTNWIEQLFKVAGLKQYQPHIYLVVNPELNAAASTGGQILIHTGLIQSCDTAAELLGVLAHEVGHIAGGHIARMDQAAQGAMLPAAAALLLGGAAALATGNPAPLIAGLSSGEHLFNRGMLKFTRTQESSADQAAMAYLDRLGWGSQGLLDFFQVIEKRTQMISRGIDPYSVTHPLTTDRIKSVEEHMHARSNAGMIPPPIEAEFQRIRAKVIGFFESPQKILNNSADILKHFSEDDRTYAKAIALYRIGKMPEAIARLESLIDTRPNDPYLYELKGQIQFDAGKHLEAIKSLEMAVQKRPNARYIKIILAHALLESKQADAPNQAKKLLIPVTQQDPDNPFAWRLLAIAHGKLNEEGQASLALAEEALAKGDDKMAKTHASRAKAALKSGPGFTRANDILFSQK
ncbi:M48 family metalloprotease [Candidatus Paracaedibacter symbiosus]|uniref:M48 family metalloprotease n=1 Tax=Candidatus Paracaedibacter symbiosus TaxID=244582 RepID=UPI000509C027|nr:M48 family metalloprotease [Candidatus Paracaedibacter symbiosus]